MLRDQSIDQILRDSLLSRAALGQRHQSIHHVLLPLRNRTRDADVLENRDAISSSNKRPTSRTRSRPLHEAALLQRSNASGPSACTARLQSSRNLRSAPAFRTGKATAPQTRYRTGDHVPKMPEAGYDAYRLG
ncbi:hypothetical protein D3C84_898790 [compost metagenome]